MANGSIVDYAVKASLDTFDAASPWNGAKLRLYQNPVTINPGNTLGQFTECNFAGYAPQNLPAFPASTVTAHTAMSTGSTVTFTITSGSQAVYGAFITDSAGANLLAAVADPNAPVQLSTTVSQYQVTVTLTLQSLY